MQALVIKILFLLIPNFSNRFRKRCAVGSLFSNEILSLFPGPILPGLSLMNISVMFLPGMPFLGSGLGIWTIPHFFSQSFWYLLKNFRTVLFTIQGIFWSYTRPLQAPRVGSRTKFYVRKIFWNPSVSILPPRENSRFPDPFPVRILICKKCHKFISQIFLLQTQAPRVGFEPTTLSLRLSHCFQ